MMINIRRKIVWLAIVMVVTIVAVAGLKCCYRPTDSCVAVLGTREVPSVEQGFVFIGGEYVRPPYRLARRGREVLVNDVVVRTFGEWPLPILSDGGVPDKLPDVPAGITEKTSEFDKRANRYIAQVLRYYYINKREAPVEEVAAVIAKLPCVAKVTQWNSEHALLIEFKSSSAPPIPTDMWPRGMEALELQQTPEKIRDSADQFLDRVAKNLNEGGYCIFGGKTDVAYQTGSDIDGTLRIVMPHLDKNASAEELSNAADAQGRRLQIPFCRELIRHKDKLDAAFRARIGMGNVEG